MTSQKLMIGMTKRGTVVFFESLSNAYFKFESKIKGEGHIHGIIIRSALMFISIQFTFLLIYFDIYYTLCFNQFRQCIYSLV